MFSNYLKTAFRYFKRNKAYTLINILGLSIGIVVSITGFLYVLNELSYDKFNENSDRIHRIAVDALAGNTAIYQTYTCAPMAQALYDFYPEVDKVCRINVSRNRQLEYKDNVFFEEQVFRVDSTFFDMFTFPVMNGSKEKLLSKPFTAVITKSTAKKYFGNEDPIDKVLRMDTLSFKVIAVVEDVPENSHFHFNIATSMISFEGVYNNPGWFANSYRTYIMLRQNTDAKTVSARLPDFTNKYLFGGEYTEVSANGNKWELYLQPLPDIHLNSDLRGEFEANGKKDYVYIFLSVSIFILLIACINFINLSVARSANRAKEVGIRKVVGSHRTELIRQFLGESILTSFIALMIAILLLEILLVIIPGFVGAKLSVPYLSNPYTIPSLILLGLVIGILSGLYPALVISSFRPIQALKNQLIKGKRSPWLRNILVIFQFVISVILIIGTFVIYNQINILQNDRLGFNKENIIVIHDPHILDNDMQVFKNDILQLPYVQHASITHTLPGRHLNNYGFRATDFDDGFTLNLMSVDEDFDDVFKIEILDGRFFSKEYGTDTAAAIINEEALKLLEYEDPVGKSVFTYGDPPTYYKIIGVVKNIYYESKHQTVQPMALLNVYGPWSYFGYLSVRVSPGDYKVMINDLTDLWEKYSAKIPIKYSFFDEDYDNLYRNEMQTRKLFLTFSFLAIFIACLGLLGLASFIVQQKTREIGIRKTFGASTFKISLLLSQSFIKWVLIANVIAWPLAWYFFNNWLNNFAYRTAIYWWYFGLALIISILIALLTVSFNTYRAATANPVDALKHE